YSYPYVEYQCKCGHHGKADVSKGEGKLPWRLEWPAKWKIFGTSVEPFGKDHAAAGGSYDSGEVLVREIFGCEPPYPIPYEFVQFKSKGQVMQMHKSKGSVVTGLEAINMNPPEVVKYMFLRVNPQKSIDYDFRDGMPIICDEYDRMERLNYTKEFTEAEENSVRAYQISRNNVLPEKQPVQVPYGHLVNLVQMADSMDGVFDILRRTGYLEGATEEDLAAIRKRAETAKYWLDNGFADDKYKFSVQKEMPQVQLTDDEKAFLKAVLAGMQAAKWDADEIGQVISEAGKASPIGTKGGFRTMYQILIAKERGPRLGNFLASMDRDFVLGRIGEAAQ
ncbi:MAG: lysine--tRNA ligase, partial [Candidatus Methanomethylophilaceae archaeon]|nr:lysine--tRNA ligase [Candidatus Methanomethylophilaceae archaeon]